MWHCSGMHRWVSGRATVCADHIPVPHVRMQRVWKANAELPGVCHKQVRDTAGADTCTMQDLHIPAQLPQQLNYPNNPKASIEHLFLEPHLYLYMNLMPSLPPIQTPSPTQSLSRRGCHSSALEVAKLLLALDPGDPLGALQLVDYLALRAGR